MRKLPVGDWADHAVSWLTKHGEPFFHAINVVVGGFVDHLESALQGPPAVAFALVVAMLGLWLRGPLFAALSFVGMMLIDDLGEWGAAMSTLAQVLVASVAALIIGIPVGIAAARSPRFAAVVRPVLDFMQTMPAFVYLLPAVFFFGIGQVPGIIATMIFSLPPGVRLTQLGIGQVDKEMVEAADAFGTPPARTLLRVQLPLALGTIMAGVNQVIMLSLSMVVISGMVGAQGLGTEVFGAITQLDIAGGVDAGLAVVILAITLDRLTGALGERLNPVARHKRAGVATGGWDLLVHYRPRPVFALSGLLVLVLLATGLGVAGSDGGKGGGKGKTLTIGYIPWDEDVAISNLWKYQLERKGYKVKLEQVDAGPLYAGVANGNVDLFLDAWLPATHADYYSKYKDRLENLGAWYDNASMQLAVLKNDPANSVQDLASDPARYKNRVVGIEPSAGEMKLMKSKVMPQYGLNGKFTLVQSSTPAMLAELTRASASNSPIVVTLWKPHWAYSKFPIKPLADPKGGFGTAEKLYMLSRKGFGKDFPELAGWLKKFKMTDQELFPLEDLIMNRYKGHEQDGVKEWVKSHPDFMDKITS
ncbi:ABC transporter permease/substrate binding protein [Actinomadura gamaensis]|uniref:ABC transporter permease/substrate binding protein n=1 Tax=Actinomadura gamaensis TaxID=1763541 RepID=A0ABV9U7C1_9ACTN